MSLEDARVESQPTNRRPVILVTPDLLAGPVDRSDRCYAVRANYAEAVAVAGGLPLIVSHESTTAAAVLDLADGLLVTGSMPGVIVETERSAFEREAIRLAISMGKPVLGICHGMQLLGEWLGGTFATSLPEGADEATDHMPGLVPDRLAHAVTVEPNSLLARIGAAAEEQVNSLHRHALTGIGRFRVVARSRDGVIEAFEGKTPGFCLGVQWHPEYGLTALDRAIFRSFVVHCASAKVPPARAGRSGEARRRLADLCLLLPEASPPAGSFAAAVRTGNLVTVSGQVPLKDGAVLRTGRLGDTVSIEEGRECARWALLNALAHLENTASGLDRVRGFVRLAGYVAAAPGFSQQGAVIEGASQLLRDVFPHCWSHARIAIGVSSLPRDVPVEIELTALVADEAA